MQSQKSLGYLDFMLWWSLSTFIIYLGSAFTEVYFRFFPVAVIVGAFLAGLLQSRLLYSIDLEMRHWTIATVLGSAIGIGICWLYFSPGGPSFVVDWVRQYGYMVTAGYLISFFVVFKLALALAQSIHIYASFGMKSFWFWLLANAVGILIYILVLGWQFNNNHMGANGGIDYWFLSLLPQWAARMPFGWWMMAAMLFANLANASALLYIRASRQEKQDIGNQITERILAH